MEALMTVVSMLAVWRAVHILQEENGPWAIFARLQARVASMKDEPGGFREGFFCFYCMSMWLSWIPAFMIVGAGLDFFIYWLAISAGAIFINAISEKLDI